MPDANRHHPNQPKREAGQAAVIFLMAVISSACGSVPAVPLDPSAHNECSDSDSVDASASEIQCFIEEYVNRSWAGLMVPGIPSDPITDQPGDPVCCEVCATKKTADDACEFTCKQLGCERARDDHIAMATQLGPCEDLECGFGFDACMTNSGAHVQWINLINTGGQLDDLYALRVDCDVHASEPTRPDGLFSYLEQLDGVPNARGATAEVTDVVAWCIEKSAAGSGTGASETSGANADGLDADTTAGTDDGGPDAPALPKRCGPWATENMGANPPNNFGIWGAQSEGSRIDDTSTQPVEIVTGGIEYRVRPCGGGASQDCVRIDKLSVQVLDPASMLAIDLNLLGKTEPMPLSPTGLVEIPAGMLRFGARTTLGRTDTLVRASNTTAVDARFDDLEGEVELLEIQASSDDGKLSVGLSLHGELLNTQPRPQLVVSPGAAWNEVVLSASTFDAEQDPITHRFMVLGQGSWFGDSIELTLPPGKHAVALFADDSHGARGIAATWVEIGGLP